MIFSITICVLIIRHASYIQEKLENTNCQLQDTRMELNALVKGMTTFPTRIVDTRNELDNLINEVTSFPTRISDTRKELDNLVKEIQHTQLDMKNIQSELKTFSCSVKDIQGGFPEIHKKLDKITEVAENTENVACEFRWKSLGEE